MSDLATIAAFAGKIAGSSLLREVRDGVVDFLAEKAGGLAGEELTGKIEALRSDAKLDSRIGDALRRAAARWAAESPDAELVTAVTKDTTFHDLPSVKAAIRKAARSPFDPIAAETLRGSFKGVLPDRFDEERVERGIAEFLDILREEFASIPDLQPALQTFADLETANYAASLPRIEELLERITRDQPPPKRPSVDT
jgi:hypothetical protein